VTQLRSLSSSIPAQPQRPPVEEKARTTYLKTASSQSKPAPIRVAHGSSVLCFL
ncbi:unnamed protein product, partial [Ectocarpus sp. 12 AP-2014]